MGVARPFTIVVIEAILKMHLNIAYVTLGRYTMNGFVGHFYRTYWSGHGELLPGIMSDIHMKFSRSTHNSHQYCYESDQEWSYTTYDTCGVEHTQSNAQHASKAHCSCIYINTFASYSESCSIQPRFTLDALSHLRSYCATALQPTAIFEDFPTITPVGCT